MENNSPIKAEAIPVRQGKSFYPEPFASMVKNRTKRKLGDYFGLTNLGVNLTTMAPKAVSAVKHCHSKQDEFIYIISGSPTLVYGEHKTQMSAGDCIGFKADNGMAHQLINQTDEDVVYIEIGDRSAGDCVEYLDDDLKLAFKDDGRWSLTHKDGEPYE